MSEHDELSKDEAEPTEGEELEEQDGEVLPRREVMSVIDVGDIGGPIYSLPVEPRD